jgi:hypothetical protein
VRLARTYTRPMVALPVWIASWVCECCGVPRRSGENVELELTFSGDVAASAEPDRIDVLPDGKVRITGSAAGRVKDAHARKRGTLIRSGAVQFAIAGAAPATRVCCTGQLWEIRHGYAAGSTRGTLSDIRWRPALFREVGELGRVIAGYGPATRLNATGDAPDEDADDWALELILQVQP